MNYDKLNVVSGWAVWLIATTIFLLTIEPTASFWDCGEFIASAYKLEVGHPPGAPLFMLLARFLMIFFSAENAAVAANSMSALASSFTILFLFWSITHLAKRLVRGELTEGAKWAVMGSGVVGALVYTFSDSFWFSAVEGEVYALSSLFTAVVFWAILKWENVADEKDHTRWIILIAYLMGLGIGVHLLSLLAIPALSLVYYFRKYEFSWKGLALTLAISGGLFIAIQEGIIKGLIQMAGRFELFFVNTLGAPFNTGVLVYAVFVAVLLTGAIALSRKKGWWAFNTFALGMTMVAIGYSTFAVIVIRSAANPPMDENNPEHLFALLSYLNREQYGDRPLLEGEYWGTPVDDTKQYLDGSPSWVKSYSVYDVRASGAKRKRSFRNERNAEKFMAGSELKRLEIRTEYVDSGEKRGSKPNFDSRYTSFFPRMYSSQASHAREYKSWSNYKGYNEVQFFESPFGAGLLSADQLAVHVAEDVLGAGLQRDAMKRALTKLCGSNGIRFDEFFELEGAEVILVKDEETGQMQRAPLNDQRMRTSVANYLISLLEQSTTRGAKYVDNAEYQLEVLEAQRNHYIQVANQGDQQARSIVGQIESRLEAIRSELKPTVGENLRFFFAYQIDWMYFRYFMWNFSGRQNDIQGHGGFMEGNWLTGLDFVDEQRLGKQDTLTDEMKENRAYNRYLMLPLLLGLFGFVFQFFRDLKQFAVVAALFFMTGLAIVVYLNQYPLQPRERDYAYVGSFYVFAMWIGLGVLALFEAARNVELKDLARLTLIPVATGVFLFVLEAATGQSHAMSYGVLFLSLLAGGLLGLAYSLRQGKVPETGRAGVIVGLTALVPLLMGMQGWDDHNRSYRETGVDFAKNYLDSLEPNAILYTNGDNDTFPLWYAQEVEGYRTDVRICNLSLLNTDWYIDQMRRQAYESAPLPFGMNEEKYRQGTRDVVLLNAPANQDDPYVDLDQAMRYALNEEKRRSIGEKKYSTLPSNSFSLPVDSAYIVDHGIVPLEEAGSIVDEVKWTLSDQDGKARQYLMKNHFAVLEMLRQNNWERPIYFAVTTGGDSYIGLKDYFRLEGLAYRLVPVKYGSARNPNQIGGIASEAMYDNVMNKWQWGNMDDLEHGIYMDENNRRMVTNLRLQMSILAEELVLKGESQKALEVLEKLLEVMPPENVPYTRVLTPTQEVLAELAGSDTTLSPEEKARAKELVVQLTHDLVVQQEQRLEYFLSLDQERFMALQREGSRGPINMSILLAQTLARAYKAHLPNDEEGRDFQKRAMEMQRVLEEREQNLIDLGQFTF